MVGFRSHSHLVQPFPSELTIKSVLFVAEDVEKREVLSSLPDDKPQNDNKQRRESNHQAHYCVHREP